MNFNDKVRALALRLIGNNNAVLAAAEPKVYVALLSQTGTNAPVATVLKNTLGGTIVWTYFDSGVFLGTLVNAFTGVVVKSISLDLGGASGGGDKPTAFITKLNDNSVTVDTFVDGVASNDVLYFASLKIEVYP